MAKTLNWPRGPGGSPEFALFARRTPRAIAAVGVRPAVWSWGSMRLPLCLRNRPPAQPWTTNFAYPDATSGNATGASPAVTLQALECTCEAEASNALRPVQVELPPETFERIELGALLEKVRDPLGLLREAHRRLS